MQDSNREQTSGRLYGPFSVSSVRKRLRSPLAVSLSISVLTFLGILGLRAAGGLEFLELAEYDGYIRLQPGAPGSESRIVLIGVTEKDIRQQGRWPLTDATLAQVLEILTRCRPRAIGLDLYRDVPVPPGHEALEAILARNRHIITVMKFGNTVESSIPPPPTLKDTDQVGFSDILVDPGGIVRRGLLFLDDGETVAHSLALRLALLYLKSEGITPQPGTPNPGHLRLGPTTIRPLESNEGGYVGADARGYQFLLDFKGARGSFPFFSLSALLSGQADPAAIRDKIVLIGVTAEGVKDFFYTPYSRGLQARQQVSGLELHAHIISQLLRFAQEGESPMATAGKWPEGAWMLFWSAMGGAMGLGVRSPWRFSLSAAGGLLALGLVAYVAFLGGWWIPSIPPAMGWLISATLVTAYMSNREKGRRALLIQLFSKHVSPEIAKVLWQQRDQFLDGGRLRPQRLTATVLLSDLTGFTTVSEKLDPQALMDWLNEYMEAMTRQVMDHGGVVNRYVGDSIEALFGVPLARETAAEIDRDAANGVDCALAMEETLVELNRHWRERGLPSVGMCIGIFTGPLVAGSLGSTQRLEYTVIGDTVNTASRLESFDKDLFAPDPLGSTCRILVGEATLRHLGERFQMQRIGEVSLKGKDQKVTIYRVLGRVDQIEGIGARD